MEISSILHQLHNSVYIAQLALAVWGIYAVYFVFRQFRRRRFHTEAAKESFLDTVRSQIEEGDFDGASQFCDDPNNLYRAIPILAKTAISKRHLPPAKLRQTLAATFDREVRSTIENQRATIATVAKGEPMLGLLGTVSGMIGAFGKIGSAEQVDPSALGADISLALVATAIGLIVAFPMTVIQSIIEVRMRNLEDSTIEGLQIVLDDVESTATTV
jgi:biopolymer transport protein ExbB/TolQ